MRTVLIAIVAMVLATAVPTHAEPEEAATNLDARGHFEKGQTHYQVGEFERAVVEYKAAYKLSKAPALLFNIAQAYRLMGDPVQALHFYRSYLRDSPNAKNRVDVEARMVDVQADIDFRKAEEQRLRKAESDKPMPVIIRRVETGSKPMRLAGMATAGAGILLLGGATFFAIKANSDWDDINEHAASGGAWTDEWVDTERGANRAEVSSAVMFAVGGAAVIAGGTVYFLGRDSKAREQKAAFGIVPMRRGAGVVFAWN